MSNLLTLTNIKQSRSPPEWTLEKCFDFQGVITCITAVTVECTVPIKLACLDPAKEGMRGGGERERESEIETERRNRDESCIVEASTASPPRSEKL